MRQKKIAFHEYDDCTVYIVPDHPARRGCLDCKLLIDDCRSLCMLEGTRYHVAHITRYGRCRTLLRRIKRIIFHHY